MYYMKKYRCTIADIIQSKHISAAVFITQYKNVFQPQ